MPWKNGGGTTTEIAVEPHDATVSTGFVWRLSLAALDGAGPFSPFPGVDRIIAQLEGLPMTLDHGADGKHTLTPLVPYRFRGEWTTMGQLTGKARDLNVMTARGKAAAHVEILTLAAGASLGPRRGSDRLIVHVLSGTGAHTNGPCGAQDTLIASSTSPGLHDAALVLSATTEMTLVLVMVRL